MCKEIKFIACFVETYPYRLLRKELIFEDLYKHIHPNEQYIQTHC